MSFYVPKKILVFDLVTSSTSLSLPVKELAASGTVGDQTALTFQIPNKLVSFTGNSLITDIPSKIFEFSFVEFFTINYSLSTPSRSVSGDAVIINTGSLVVGTRRRMNIHAQPSLVWSLSLRNPAISIAIKSVLSPAASIGLFCARNLTMDLLAGRTSSISISKKVRISMSSRLR